MREIKFRAWDSCEEKMLYAKDNFPVYHEQYNGLHSGKSADNGQWGNFDLMQYTGLKDKNGVEIYEGDILYYYQEDDKLVHDDDTVEYEKKIGVVRWGGYYPAFDIMDLYNRNIPAHDCEYNLFSGENHYIEVIGNVYEHKHLLDNN